MKLTGILSSIFLYLGLYYLVSKKRYISLRHQAISKIALVDEASKQLLLWMMIIVVLRSIYFYTFLIDVGLIENFFFSILVALTLMTSFLTTIFPLDKSIFLHRSFAYLTTFGSLAIIFYLHFIMNITSVYSLDKLIKAIIILSISLGIYFLLKNRNWGYTELVWFTLIFIWDVYVYFTLLKS